MQHAYFATRLLSFLASKKLLNVILDKEIKEEWRKLYYAEVHNLYSSINIIKMFNS
jgi:hypothetical protein